MSGEKGNAPMVTTTTDKRETTNLIGSDKVEGTAVYVQLVKA
jgi:hypothetical protein